MIPILILAQILAIWLATTRAQKLGKIAGSGKVLVATMLILFALWAGASSYLAISGVYQSAWFLSSWPSFWVSFIAVAIFMAPLFVSFGARETVRGVIDATPLHWMVGFQGLRMLAIGGILKALNGDFSLYFALYIGVPDFIFGLSAFVMAWLVYQNRVSVGVVIGWNFIGALIIVPFAVVLVQMGLPGPWQTFTGAPTIAMIFEFPMALAITIVVPVFVLMNMLISARLIERSMRASDIPKPQEAL